MFIFSVTVSQKDAAIISAIICAPSGNALGDEDDVDYPDHSEGEAGAVDGVVPSVLVQLSPDEVHEGQDGLAEAGEHRYYRGSLP